VLLTGSVPGISNNPFSSGFSELPACPALGRDRGRQASSAFNKSPYLSFFFLFE
jgi:hypothetical protein